MDHFEFLGFEKSDFRPSLHDSRDFAEGSTKVCNSGIERGMVVFSDGIDLPADPFRVISDHQ